MKRILAVVLILAFSGAGLLGWVRASRRSVPETPPPVVRAQRRVFSSTVRATGAVKPQVGAEVRVGSRISGRVVRLHANIKDVVRKGQVIAELEKVDLEAAVAQREAEGRAAEARLKGAEILLPREIDKARAEVSRWEATVELSRKELERQRALLEQEFTAQQTRDQAEERLRVAEAQLEFARKVLEVAQAQQQVLLLQARAEVDRARAVLADARVQLSYAVIAAPLSGVVGSVSTQEGETVAAGLSAPTFVTIVDLERLQVDAYVDEVDIGKVRVGQAANFTVEAFPAQDFEGKAVAIYPKPVVIDNVVKYVVAVEISTAFAGRLRPEMTADVTLRLEERTVLAIPAKAVRRESGRNVVHVRRGTGSEPRPVRLGWKDAPWVEVADGLKEGDEVLLDVPAAAEGGGS
jgi:HlyD family secretion protein